MQRWAIAAALMGLLFGLLGATVGIAETGSSDHATIERIEAWQAPADEVAFDDAGDVRAAINNGTLSRATVVNGTQLVVLGLELRGFEEAVTGANGSTVTDRFQTAFNERGDLTVRQANPDRSHVPLWFVDALNSTGVRVHPDAANESYYVAIDLRDRTAYQGKFDGSWERMPENNRFTFDVLATLDGDLPNTDDATVAATAIKPRTAEVDEPPVGDVWFRPRSNQTVTGTTNLGVGSMVTVAVTGNSNPDTGENESFRLVQETTVQMGDSLVPYRGRFDARFDMREVAPTARNVSVDIRVDDRSLLDAPVPARVSDYSASVDDPEVVTDGDVAGVRATATLSPGGLLVLHEDTVDGLVVGHSTYLEPDDETVTVYVDQPTDADELVVVAHRDGNHNRWFDAAGTDPRISGVGSTVSVEFDVELPDGEPVVATATATPTDAPPDETTPTATPDEATPNSSSAPGTRTTTPGTESSSSGGLGGAVLPLLGVLLAGAIALAILRLR